MFSGEAFVFNEVSPDVMGKILTYIYCAEPPSLSQQSWSPSATHLSLSQQFPAFNNHLASLKGHKNTVHLDDGTTKDIPLVTNEQKWACVLQYQASVEPYTLAECSNCAEVMKEMAFYATAEQFEVFGLKQTSLQKVTAWFEAEFQRGAPFSNDVHECATFVLKEHSPFVQAFIGLCAKFFPVVEKDSKVMSLMGDLQPIALATMQSMRLQWAKELKQKDYEVENSKQSCLKLEKRMGVQANISKQAAAKHKTQVDTMRESLAQAAIREQSTKAKLSELQNLTKSLQTEVLAHKTSARNLLEANRTAKAQQTSIQVQHLTGQVKNLERALASKEQALDQSRAANQNIKNDLRADNEYLANENDEIKLALKRAFKHINTKCVRCKSASTTHVTHHKYREILVQCRGCNSQKCFDGRTK
jgi:hypothetical protein